MDKVVSPLEYVADSFAHLVLYCAKQDGECEKCGIKASCTNVRNALWRVEEAIKNKLTKVGHL